jgi:hypothetical protein
MTRTKSAAKPYLEIKNWTEFQHYGSSRHAIWIKLYARLLDDVDGFLELPEVTQAHLVKIWLLALRQQNRIPFRLAWIETEITAHTHVDFERLIAEGWLVPKNISEVDVEALIEENRSRPLPDSILASELSSDPASVSLLAGREKRREEKRYPSISSPLPSDSPSPTGSRVGRAAGPKTSPAREAAGA